MKAETRKLLDEAIKFGKRNSGYGYSTAKLIQQALIIEDKEDETGNDVSSETSTG